MVKTIKTSNLTADMLALLRKGDGFLLAHDNHRAIGCYQAALAAKPDLWEAYYRMAMACHRLGKFQPAIELLQKCLKHYKKSYVVNLLAKIYMAIGEFDKAHVLYRKVLSKDKTNVVAKAGISSVLLAKGQVRQAFDLVRPLITRVSKSAFDIDVVNIAVAVSIKAGEYDCIEKYLKALKASDWMENKYRSQIVHMLGEVYNSQKSYHAAIQCFIKANDALKLEYQPEYHNELLKKIKTVFPSLENNSRHVGKNTCSPEIVFVVGMPRSGTTLVEQILSSHSEVYGAGELTFISDLMTGLVSTYGKRYPDCLYLLTDELLDQMRRQYLSLLPAEACKQKYIVDKMPHNFIYIGFMRRIFPNAKIIYCTRNPVDTCLSIYFTRFDDSHTYARDFEALAHQYKFCVDMMAFWQTTFEDIYHVEYENMVLDIENELRGLFAYCGIEVEAQCYEFYKNKRFVGTASKDQVSKPLYSTSIGRWKHYLPLVQPLVDALAKKNLV